MVNSAHQATGKGATVLLQPLFAAPIRRQTYLYPGYDDHASDVWRIETDLEDVIVRRSRITDYPANPFQTGVWQLFGVDPRRLASLARLNALLAGVSPIPVPQVVRTGTIDGVEYGVLERMPGQPLQAFKGDALMEGLGEALARIHSLRFDHCGSPFGGARYPLTAFPERLAATLRAFAPEEAVLQAALEPMCAAALALRPPEWGSLIMPDMDASQFLTDGVRITALVDTEFYAVGPRELDFVALELVLDHAAADALARGYQRVLPLPQLGEVRPIYRYLYRLMEIQGKVPLRDWMDRPVRFTTTSKDYRCCASCIHFRTQKTDASVRCYCSRLGYDTKPSYKFNCWSPKEHIKALLKDAKTQANK